MQHDEFFSTSIYRKVTENFDERSFQTVLKLVDFTHDDVSYGLKILQINLLFINIFGKLCKHILAGLNQLGLIQDRLGFYIVAQTKTKFEML